MQSSTTARKLAIVAAILFTVPVLGWLTSRYVASDLETQFKQSLVSCNNHL
jgi:hypothetical protein